MRGVPNKPKVYVDSRCFIQRAQAIGKNEIGRGNDVWLVKQLLYAAHHARVASTLSIAECQHAKVRRSPIRTSQSWSSTYVQFATVFRANPAEIRAIENNLSIANMDFFEFAIAVDKEGIFQGFRTP